MKKKTVEIGTKLFFLTLKTHQSSGNGTFECVCGNTKILAIRKVRIGHIKSCGCRKKDLCRKSSLKHGMHHLPEASIWSLMKSRCSNKNYPNYQSYGGRGIKVCDRWKIFENFYADLGPRPTKNHSLERIDNNGDYEPQNCKWATREEQSRNKRNSIFLVANGERLHVFEWAKRLQVKPSMLITRVKKYGWSHDRAIYEPRHKHERTTK